MQHAHSHTISQATYFFKHSLTETQTHEYRTSSLVWIHYPTQILGFDNEQMHLEEIGAPKFQIP
jgi:hypothetical protein